MGQNIHFKQLGSQDASTHRCMILEQNKLQCGNRATFELEGGTQMCKFHFFQERELGANLNGDNYIDDGVHPEADLAQIDSTFKDAPKIEIGEKK